MEKTQIPQADSEVPREERQHSKQSGSAGAHNDIGDLDTPDGEASPTNDQEEAESTDDSDDEGSVATDIGDLGCFTDVLRYFLLAAAEVEKVYHEGLKDEEAKAVKPPLFSSELVSYLLADSAVLEFITDGEGESAIEDWVMSRSFLRYVNACSCTPPVVPKKLIHLIRTIDFCIQEHRNMVYNKSFHRLEHDPSKDEKNNTVRYMNFTQSNIIRLGEWLIDVLDNMSYIIAQRYFGDESPSLEEQRTLYCDRKLKAHRVFKSESTSGAVLETIHENMVDGWIGNDQRPTAWECTCYEADDCYGPYALLAAIREKKKQEAALKSNDEVRSMEERSPKRIKTG